MAYARMTMTSLLLAGSLAGTPLAAQDRIPPSDPRLDAVRNTVLTLVERGEIPAIAVAVALGGEVVWQEGFGAADRAANVAATAHTMFSLASISKPITATGLMVLAERGAVALDRPANSYLGRGRLRAFEGRAEDATLRRLLTHTAGLPLHYQFFYEGGPAVHSMDEAIDRYGVLVYPPGERYVYSNLGFGVLDHVIARVSGRSFEEFMREEVFLPLGLRNTVIGSGRGLAGRAAVRYSPQGEPIPYYTLDHLGASAVWSSAHDLVRFGMFHLGHLPDGARAILRRATIESMQSAHAATGTPGASRGLGWGILENDHGLVRVSHTGGMPGVTTALSLFPEEDLVVVVLANRSGSPVTRIATDIAAALLPRYAAELAARRARSTSSPAGAVASGPPANLVGAWRGRIIAARDTVPLFVMVEPDEVRVELAGEPLALLGIRADGDMLIARTATRFTPADATPAAERDNAVALLLNFVDRGDRLAGWAAAVDTAQPIYGAVSFHAELHRVTAPPIGARLRYLRAGIGSSADAQRLLGHVQVFSADSMEGRGAGYAGETRAATYIARRFAAAGLTAPPGRDGYLQPFTFHARRPPVPFEQLNSANVLGWLEGSDPELRGEVVVIGAHYDGQGMAGQADPGRRPGGTDAQPGDTVWHSANDNAAGVAALLAVAEALRVEGLRPRRSVLFIAFGAEEHGLAGSLHYTAQPVVPWDRQVAMINLEMIGWEAARTLNVRATATSRDWPALLERATSRTGVPVTTLTPELTNDTDHYGFGVRGVPSVHYGVGGDREHYHRVTDTAQRIAGDALATRTRHILALLLEVADGRERLSFDWRHPRDYGLTGTALTPAEHAALGLAAEAGGLKVTGVAEGLAAARAGARAGDVIVRIGGRPLASDEPGLRALRDALQATPAAEPLAVSVLRAGRPHDLRLVFEEAVSLRGQPLQRPALAPDTRRRLEADLAAARLAYERAPNDPDAIIWYGRRLAYLGRYRDAIRVFAEGIDKHPNDARMYRHRGHRWITVREFDRAIADFERATELTRGQPDEIEPDGAPNRHDIPRSSLQSNIWYHLALAHYLKHDFERALPAWLEAMKVSTNDDMLVATADWLYMTYRRLGRAAEATEVLARIQPDMEILENDSYHRRLLMYKGLVEPASLLAADGDAVALATQGYGVGNWFLYNNQTERAHEVFERILRLPNWAAFGWIAAEAELLAAERDRDS